MPKVSILSPTYNHEKYVTEAIQSVFNQTFQDFELIVADDASTDSTVEKISKFQDKRLTLLRNEHNLGSTATSKRCWQQCSGEYIITMATDDICEPTMIETLVNYLDKHPEAMAVFGSANCIDESGNLLSDSWTDVGVGQDRFTHLQQLFKLQHPFCSIAGMFRRETLEQLGYFPLYLKQTDDMAHYIKMLFHGSMPILPDKILRYRWQANNGNISSRTPENDARLDFELFEIIDLYKENITSVDLLRKIFPEVDEYPCPLEENLIVFHLAQICLSFNYPSHRLYGLHQIYQMLKDETMAAYLKTQCNFTYADFFKLAGTQPVIMDFAVLNENKDLKARLEAMKYELQTVNSAFAEAHHRLAPIPKYVTKFFNRTRRITSFLKALWQD